MPPIHLGDDSSDDGEFVFNNQQSPSPQSKYQTSNLSNMNFSKIPLTKSSSLRSSMDSNSLEGEASSPFSTASPKAIETVRQITRLETPLKKATSNASHSNASGMETPKRSCNYGFTVTPFDSKKTVHHHLERTNESPSAEELLRRLANTREQFNQTLNAERTSPKILSKTIEDEWKGMADFLKQPASPYASGSSYASGPSYASSGQQQQQKYAQFVSLDDQVSETESLQLKNSIASYEDTKSRLERIRQKSKEMLSSSESVTSSSKKSGRNFYFYTFLLVACLSALFFVFFDERLVLQFLEYFQNVNISYFRKFEIPPLAYEDFYAKALQYIEQAQEYAELGVEWARDKFDL